MAGPAPADVRIVADTDGSTANDRGFLLAMVDGFTRGWVNAWSIAAIPPLRRRDDATRASQQTARDVFVTTWWCLAVVGAVLAGGVFPLWVSRAIGAVALYRATDLLISVFRAGVFLSFRGDIEIGREPRWRIQRLLLAIFINYFELILWYATLYRYASRAADASGDGALGMFAAVNASFSTMTTLGNGVSPTSWPLTALVVAQWFTSVLLLVVVVGLLVSLLTADQHGKLETGGASSPSGWTTPIAITIVLLLACYAYLWLVFPHPG